jgi:hypothetical protein
MQNSPQKINPLMGMMRQPKIYIKLPSNGNYWSEGSLQVSTNGEYPVYSMTAKDELILKTPDALLNGQAVVDVIQSCIPNIVDAWECPQIDIDLILVAIRLSTYGEMMDANVNVNGVEGTYSVDLKTILDGLYSLTAWDEVINIGNVLKVHVRPLTYKKMSAAAAQTFETQRIINLVNDTTVNEEEKLEIFKKSFNKLTNLTLDVITESIFAIETNSGLVTEPEFIKEFMENCDKDIFNQVKDHLDRLRDQNTIRPLKVKASDDMIAAGSAEEIEVPIVFDPATFFG